MKIKVENEVTVLSDTLKEFFEDKMILFFKIYSRTVVENNYLLLN